MRVIMQSYMTTAEGVEHKPGDPVEFDEGECQRLVGLGSARLPTAADDDRLAAEAEAANAAKATAEKAVADQVAADKAAAEKAAADKAAADKGKK